MPGEKDTIFSSKVKYSGVFPFPDFYRFCYDWLKDDAELDIVEDQYVEKIKGNSKDIDIVWTGSRKASDYFKFSVKVKFRILGMTNVEISQQGVKVKMNQGNVEVKLAGTLIKDYQGKFEQNAFQKFLRSIYEKWVIPSRVSEFEDKLAKDCDEFLSQIKAYLDLEGKR